MLVNETDELSPWEPEKNVSRTDNSHENCEGKSSKNKINVPEKLKQFRSITLQLYSKILRPTTILQVFQKCLARATPNTTIMDTRWKVGRETAVLIWMMLNCKFGRAFYKKTELKFINITFLLETNCS